MNKMVPIKFSNTIYQMRGVGILLVAFCHCSYDDATLDRARGIIGVIGVPLFFICSGIFFRLIDVKIFAKKKVLNVIIPWILWGVITYGWSVHCGGVPSVKDGLLWIIGTSTWLYFVPMYLLTQVLLYSILLLELRWINYLMIILSIISITVGYSGYKVLGSIYLNPLNWIGYVVIGYLIRDYLLEQTKDIPKKKSIVMLLFLSVVLFLVYFNLREGSYFSFITIPFVVLSFFALYEINNTISIPLLRKMGMNSFVIFFSHMQFGMGYVEKFIQSLKTYYFLYEICKYFKPILAVLLVLIPVEIIVMMAKKGGFERYIWILGLRG